MMRGAGSAAGTAFGAVAPIPIVAAVTGASEDPTGPRAMPAIRPNVAQAATPVTAIRDSPARRDRPARGRWAGRSGGGSGASPRVGSVIVLVVIPVILGVLGVLVIPGVV